jgi:hypothetical protein
MGKSLNLRLSLKKFLKSHYPDSFKFKEMIIHKGIKNSELIANFTYRSWPFWVSKQLQSHQNPHINDTNYLGLINTKFRNWTYLSSPDSSNAVIVDPVGLIHVKNKPFSIDFWISNSNSLFIPSHKDDIIQEYLTESNSIKTSFTLSQLDIESHVIFSKIPGNLDFIYCNYSISNNTKKNIKFSFYIALRPFDFEGVSDVESIQFLQNGMFMVNSELGLILDKKPDNIVCLSHQDGDVSEHFNKLEMIFNTTCKLKKASAFAEYRLVIPPNKTESISFKAPCSTKSFNSPYPNFLQKQSPIEFAKQTYESFSFDKVVKELSYYKSDLLSQEIDIQLPNEQINNFIKAQFSFLLSSIHTTYFKHGFYEQLNHSLWDHLVFMRMMYISGYKPAIFQNIFTYKYLQKINANLKAKRLYYADSNLWFENLLYLYQENLITITEEMYKLLFKIISTGLKQLKIHSQIHIKTLPPRHSKNTSDSALYLADIIGLYGAIQSFKYLSQKLPYSSIDTFNNLSLSQYSIILSESIDSLCNYFSDKISFQEAIPTSTHHYISLDLIKTLYLYSKYFPTNKNRIQSTLSQIQKHLIFNDLVFSMINPSGFPLEDNLDYLLLISQLSPSDTFPFIVTLLSCTTQTYTYPDTIHPMTLGGSEGDGHTIKHGIIFADHILKTVISYTNKNLTLFSAIPVDWLINHSWHIKNYRINNALFSITVTQTETETIIELTSSKPKTVEFIIFNTHFQFKSFNLSGNDILINSQLIKIPGSESTIRFKKHYESQTTK